MSNASPTDRVVSLSASPVHVIGAGGRSGAALCRALMARNIPVIAIARNAARFEASGLPLTPRIADLTGSQTRLAEVLADAERVVCTAHARNIPALLTALKPDVPLIALGSTRRFTRWPDEHGNGVMAGERALFNSGRPGMILHPTRIYGTQGEDNVQRLATLLRKLPIVPLPGGGKALVQPIHQDDVTNALLAALSLRLTGPESLIVAGPEAVTYRDFIALVAKAAGIRPRPVISLPAPVLMTAGAATRYLPRIPSIAPTEIRRLLEDKAFDITPMENRLGLKSRSLEAGLIQLFRD